MHSLDISRDTPFRESYLVSIPGSASYVFAVITKFQPYSAYPSGNLDPDGILLL